MKEEEKKNRQNLNTEEKQQEKETKQEEKEQETNQETAEQSSQKEDAQSNNKQTQEESVKEEAEGQTEAEEQTGQEPSEAEKEAKKGKEAEAKKEGKKGKEAEKEKEGKKGKSDQEKLAELQDKYLRLSAEYDNYRKRTLKEKMELTKSAGEDILKGLLPVMDDFERALQSVDEAGDVQAVKDGVHLIYNKFKEFLQQQGVQEIEAQDQEFNTDKHEAISKVPAPSEDMKGKVVDVVQKGYYLNDKVLRFARVVVGE